MLNSNLDRIELYFLQLILEYAIDKIKLDSLAI